MILNGKKIADEIHEELSKNISQLSVKPKLAAFLVGDNPASLKYIRQKRRFAKKVWMKFDLYQYDTSISEKDLSLEIEKCNTDPHISGYIVQLPLPEHIDSSRIFSKIDPAKDVDGFHPINQWKVLIGDTSGFTPCTPAGIMKIFSYYNVSLRGKRVIILGQSTLVWKPLSLLCMNAGATVVSCNSKTTDISHYTKNADIIVCATGVAHLLTPDMLWDTTLIIDVGFSIVDGNIFGDADTKNILKHGHDITPVPGWVGPMTVAMLLLNTYKAYESSLS